MENMSGHYESLSNKSKAEPAEQGPVNVTMKIVSNDNATHRSAVQRSGSTNRHTMKY
jgi:hypothetical protein